MQQTNVTSEGVYHAVIMIQVSLPIRYDCFEPPKTLSTSCHRLRNQYANRLTSV